MSHNTPIEADTSVVEGTAGEAGGGGGAGSGGFSAVSMSQRLTEFWDAVLTYTIDNGLTLTRVWATSFDRARTSRNTMAQFHKGASLLGVNVPVTEETASIVWKDMLKHRSRRRLGVNGWGVPGYMYLGNILPTSNDLEPTISVLL